jgi:hypothetical protein
MLRARRTVDSDEAPAPQRNAKQPQPQPQSTTRRKPAPQPAGKAPLLDRLRTAIVNPVDPADGAQADEPRPADELEAAVRSADDKERLIGLIAAPFAAAIGILVTSALTSNDPAALLKNGQVNTLHVNPSVYEGLAGVLIGLSVLILVLAMIRKRLFLGIAMALYGLAIFNLHYWGFGVPFILAGAWLLVRAYRLQRELKEATGTGPSPGRNALRSQASRRYTPPASPRKR